jgi:copper amine oxidase-like protein
VIHALTFAAYTVTLDGKTVLPHTRAAVVAGRVLLPIRTLGNALGADIGYDGHAHLVTVQRGSHVARVHLNCRECIVHGTAYVPLRDVAVAFGLGVSYDAAARTVALQGVRPAQDIARAQPVAPETAPPLGPPSSYAQPAQYTVSLQPASGAAVHDPYPAISARFAGAASIDPRSLRVLVDGRDVTAEAAVIGDQVLFTPRRALAPGSHDVSIAGRDATGAPLAQQWSFNDSFTFAVAPAPTPFPIGAIWLDRWIVPGTSAFDVYVEGAPGITGYVGVDGIGGFFPLIVNSATSYVAHVAIPPGTYQPNARIAARLTLPNGQLTTIVLPQLINIYTKALPPPVNPYGTPTPIPRTIPVRRSVDIPTPTATPTRAPVRTPLLRTPLPPTAAPTATPAPTPSPVRTRRPLIRRTVPPSPVPT